MALQKQCVLPQALKFEQPEAEKSLFKCLPCRRSKRKSKKENIKYSFKKFQSGSKISNTITTGLDLAKDCDLQTVDDLKKQLSDQENLHREKLKNMLYAYDTQGTKDFFGKHISFASSLLVAFQHGLALQSCLEKNATFIGNSGYFVIIIKHQRPLLTKTKLNNMALICLENAMTIEKKNSRIASLEMEIISLKSGFSRERERWSNLIYNNSDPDMSSDTACTDDGVTSDFQKVKPNPIREYLQIHFFDDSF